MMIERFFSTNLTKIPIKFYHGTLSVQDAMREKAVSGKQVNAQPGQLVECCSEVVSALLTTPDLRLWTESFFTSLEESYWVVRMLSVRKMEFMRTTYSIFLEKLTVAKILKGAVFFFDKSQQVVSPLPLFCMRPSYKQCYWQYGRYDIDAYIILHLLTNEKIIWPASALVASPSAASAWTKHW